ncbi:hypothetical protein J132_04066 [Termitomyces sp. J132]|nr:hypothetical protein C0989_011331 [Termitomyces sp. Mn162]KNZ72272.1 hypothetical protein J132_04066 [Termitomyces sp. J132]
METYFDNKGNILNSCIRSTRDKSALYTLKTTFGLRGRKLTVLLDENPAPGRSSHVASLNWKDKSFEILGQRKTLSEVRRTQGGFFKKTRHWRWTADRKEYELRYDDDEGWKATLNDNMSIGARFLVPGRPHLFGKLDPPALHLTKTALEADEIFLILVLIYSEIKRQDSTVRNWSQSG